MAYAVIEFCEANQVETIFTNWFVSDQEEFCLWPPKKLSTKAQDRVTVDLRDARFYAVALKPFFYKTITYKLSEKSLSKIKMHCYHIYFKYI